MRPGARRARARVGGRRRARRWPPPPSWAPTCARSASRVAADDAGRAVVAWSQRASAAAAYRERAVAALRAAPATRRSARPSRWAARGAAAEPGAGAAGSRRRGARGMERRALRGSGAAPLRVAGHAAALAAILAPSSHPEGRTTWQWTASSEPDRGRTSAIRAPSRTTAHTFTGWISTTGNVWVARYTAGGQAHQARDLQGPRPRRPQQPVARLPPRRAHHGLLLAALRAPPAAPGDPERDALHGLAEPVLDQRLRAGAHRRRPTSPAAWATPIPNPVQLKRQAVAVLARRRLEPDLLLHRRRHPLGAGPRARVLRARAAAVHEVRRRRQRSIHGIFTDGHPENWKNSLHYMRYENRALYAASGAKLGTPGPGAVAHLQARPHLQLLRPGRARVGARHRAHRRGPPAGRLHAPGRQPRHLLLRLPQRHEVDQPQDRRGRGRPPVLPLRRRDPRPRGSALRLPVAHDRPLEPGRAVVHAGLGAHVDASAAHQRPQRLRHPPGDAARARRAPTASSTSGATSAPSASRTTRRASTRSTSRPPRGGGLLQRAADARGVEPVRGAVVGGRCRSGAARRSATPSASSRCGRSARAAATSAADVPAR